MREDNHSNQYFIFVTGGVVSGLGKGITAASVGLLLKENGFSVDAIKFDPYLNVDPGTMSPYEHGEVYVLSDGTETDLDLGHYERFININLNWNSSVTAGRIYTDILAGERRGDYLGKNVQLIPDVTNYIQSCFVRGLPENDVKNKFVRLIEIGGSSGDMEAEIFLESFRQFKSRKNYKILHIHLGFIPYLDCSGEYKTKPMQVSIRELLRLGLQPDILVARYHPIRDYSNLGNLQTLDSSILNKLALFGNLSPDQIVPLPDLRSIYTVPLWLQSTSLISNLESFVDQKLAPIGNPFFAKVQNQLENPKTEHTFSIGLIAKYGRLGDAYLSVIESVRIAAIEMNVSVKVEVIDSQQLEEEYQSNPKVIIDQNLSPEWQKLKACNGIIVPGGFGKRGMEGKILACRWARESGVPFLGICLGLQMAVVEFGRNVLGINAYSREMLEDSSPASSVSKEFMVDFMQGQENADKGGSMRLGNYDCDLKSGSLIHSLFNQNVVVERHRHRLEVQNQYIDNLEANGLIVSGKHFVEKVEADHDLFQHLEKNFLVEMIELDQKKHPFYVATQSHPEFLSRPGKPHPLFLGLVKAIVG